MRVFRAIVALLGAQSGALACTEAPIAERREPVERASVVDTSPPRGPWLLVASVDELAPTLDSGKTELWAAAGDRKAGEALASLSAGAFDDRYWVSIYQNWSPDGRTLVFDAQHSFHPEDYETRLFWIDFSTGLPSKPHLIENLPKGVELWLGAWGLGSNQQRFDHRTRKRTLRRKARCRRRFERNADGARRAGGGPAVC